MTDQTTAVRAAHVFDTENLHRWLKANMEGIGADFAVRQFAGGQSNPTFLITSGRRRYVMRKKPPGTLLKSAHQVDREYRVMKALGETDVPVPRMHVLCDDESVVGTAFYVMDFIEGRIFREQHLPDVAPAERAAIYDSMNENLARLHRVDYRAIGLETFGKPGNYFGRQVGLWTMQYRAAQTETVESMENLIAWMPAHIPSDDTTSIAHGDYRLENSIYHPTEPRMLAILDWELSTIGHPLADLGYNIMGYRMTSPTQGGLTNVDFKTSGIPDEATYVRRYCERTGRDGVENLDFYIGFAIFRLAAIAQGVYRRGLDGNASSERAGQYGNVARFLSDNAWAMVEKIA